MSLPFEMSSAHLRSIIQGIFLLPATVIYYRTGTSYILPFNIVICFVCLIINTKLVYDICKLLHSVFNYILHSVQSFWELGCIFMTNLSLQEYEHESLILQVVGKLFLCSHNQTRQKVQCFTLVTEHKDYGHQCRWSHCLPSSLL